MDFALAAIAEVRMGYSFRSRLETDVDGDVAVIQMKDIDDSNLLHPEGLARIRMPDLKDRHLVQKGDLLFRSRGVTNSAALVGEGYERTVLAAPMLLIRPKTEIVEPGYLQWFINHPATQAVLAGRAAGTAVKMLGKAVLDGIEVVLPPLERQHLIVEVARLALREAEILDRERQLRLRAHHDSLLRAAGAVAYAKHNED
ncbi:restriction endonuclease subunit S [Burkholderia pseudomallei]|uniref:restriction endonuclease subunit S n=1 Tax=Burkholderia pseudomallei TaxID=28450 RepID=UPI000F05955A|nr:restriction endonuclease subunit S [Burkholderia pseudomallei]